MLRRVFKILLCMIVALNVTVAPAAVAEPTTMSPVVNVKYIHDAIFYLIENEESDMNVIKYLTVIHKKSATTVTNGIQNAIYHAWRTSPIEDLTKYYTARVNYETGVPTTMEFLYYYRDKIKKMI